MDTDTYKAEIGRLLAHRPQVGDILTVDREGMHAAVTRVCRHKKERHVEIRLDFTVPPRWKMIGNPKDSQPALKGYLVDQGYEGPIHRVKVMSVSEKSCYVDVV